MSKKLLVYGAFGRHNLGDMLFPWVVDEYLRVEGVECDVEYADLLPRDMRYMGGHYVKGISDFFDCNEEVNLFVAGGEVGRCGLLEALGFLEPATQDVASLSKLFAVFEGFPAYLPRKSCFLNPGSFFTGAIGGFSDPCASILEQYESVFFRDLLSSSRASRASQSGRAYGSVPDVAIAAPELLASRVDHAVRLSPGLRNLFHEYPGGYVLMQVSAKWFGLPKFSQGLKKVVDGIRVQVGLPVVLICAGSVPGTDSVSAYIMNLIGGGSSSGIRVWEVGSIWDDLSVISRASFCVSTSLHMRILSAAYAIPRLTLFRQQKVDAFISQWDDVKEEPVEVELECVVESICRRISGYDRSSTLANNKRLVKASLSCLSPLKDL